MIFTSHLQHNERCLVKLKLLATWRIVSFENNVVVSLSYSGSSLALARPSKVWFVSVLVSFVCVQARLRGQRADVEFVGLSRQLLPLRRTGRNAGPDGLIVFVLRRACAEGAMRAAQALSVSRVPAP